MISPSTTPTKTNMMMMIYGAEFLIYFSTTMVTIFFIFGCAKLKRRAQKSADSKPPTTPATIPVPVNKNTKTAIPAPPMSIAPKHDRDTVSMQPTEDPDLKSRENYDIQTTDETYISKIKTQQPLPK